MNKIINISWTRANLHIKLDKVINDEVCLEKKEKTIKLGHINGDEIIINITNTPEGEMLADGTWSIKTGEAYLTIDEKLLKSLADKSRIFPYRNEKYAYLVDFAVKDDFILNIKTMFVMKNNKPTRFYRLNENSSALGKLKTMVTILGVLFLNLLYKTARALKINHNTIMFMTENSNELSGNLKSLYEQINKNKHKVIVFCKNRYDKKYNFYSLFSATLMLAKADTIILDNYVQILTHINLSKKVKLIQLWHAGIGFKSVGYARFGLTGSPHPYKSCHRKYTEAIVDSPDFIDIYKEVFGCKSEIIHPYGIPRIDNYLNRDVINKTCEKLYKINNDLKNKKTILFSPTYRGSNAGDAYYDNNKIDLNQIGKFCKQNDFIFIIKMHPFIKEKISIPSEYSKYIIDYSNVDINELIYISDIMITDYSSCAYEYSLFNRPLIFYRYDKTIYEYLRPMHSINRFTNKQYEVTSFNELISTLKQLTNVDISKRFTNIKEEDSRNSSKKIIKNFIGD